MLAGLRFYSDLIISLFLGLFTAVILLIVPNSLKLGPALIPIALLITSLIFYYLRTRFGLMTSLLQCLVNSLVTYGFALLIKLCLKIFDAGTMEYVLAGIMIFAFFSSTKQILDLLSSRFFKLENLEPRLKMW